MLCNKRLIKTLLIYNQLNKDIMDNVGNKKSRIFPTCAVTWGFIALYFIIIFCIILWNIDIIISVFK